MKRISILVLILCACFVPVAWGQQAVSKGQQLEPVPPAQHEALRTRMRPCLTSTMLVTSTQKWSYTSGGTCLPHPP